MSGVVVKRALSQRRWCGGWWARGSRDESFKQKIYFYSHCCVTMFHVSHESRRKRKRNSWQCMSNFANFQTTSTKFNTQAVRERAEKVKKFLSPWRSNAKRKCFRIIKRCFIRRSLDGCFFYPHLIEEFTDARFASIDNFQMNGSHLTLIFVAEMSAIISHFTLIRLLTSNKKKTRKMCALLPPTRTYNFLSWRPRRGGECGRVDGRSQNEKLKNSFRFSWHDVQNTFLRL